MAKYIVAKIKGTIALAGGRAFFVPAGFNRRYVMTEAIERNDNEYAKWIAGQIFESAADAIPLDGMANNDDMSARGINEGIWMRTCAVILQDDDKQLYAKFKDDKSAQFWLDFTERLNKFIEGQKAGLEIFEACSLRLLVCLSRYEVAMEAHHEQEIRNSTGNQPRPHE